MVFAEGWEKVNNAMDVDPVIAAVGPGWVDWMPSALERLSGAPNTITHGDYRADNILFDEEGNVVLLDFQLTGRGRRATTSPTS